MDVHLLLWIVGANCGGLASLAVLARRRAVGWASAGAVVVAGFGLLVGATWQSRLEMAPTPSAVVLSLTGLGSGVRLPLGMLVGGVVAGVWCLLFRVPWRPVGDALAVASFTTTLVGRFGCLLGGCCMGKVCPTWAASLCVRPHPGTEAFARQLMILPVVGPDFQPAPVLPLPLVFAAGSLAILMLLVWLLRRDAPPGSLLPVACILGSLGKLALEPLRAAPRPPALQLGIPALTLVVALVVLAIRRLHASAPDVAASALPAGTQARRTTNDFATYVFDEGGRR